VIRIQSTVSGSPPSTPLTAYVNVVSLPLPLGEQVSKIDDPLIKAASLWSNFEINASCYTLIGNEQKTQRDFKPKPKDLSIDKIIITTNRNILEIKYQQIKWRLKKQ